MHVTPLYAGLLALWFVVLSFRVIQKRRAGISLGDGGDVGMLRRIRAHANFAEYVPLVLVMMAVLESSRTSIYVLHGLGVALLLGRLLHGYAFSFSDNFPLGRAVGTVLTLAALIVGGVLCVLQSVEGMASL
jgi:uncharacterized membrane protein YecN with MAPEG domain